MTVAAVPPTPTMLRQLIDYEPATGRMRWRERDREFFTSDRDCRWWNARYAGKPAGTVSGAYIVIKLFDVQYFAHRVAWAIHFGIWPSTIVDHRNGNGHNNRIRNLRAGSRKFNQRNQKMHCSNTSGVTGVRWNTQRSKWTASIGHEGRTIYLGGFETKLEAEEARAAANRKYGFSRRHGT